MVLPQLLLLLLLQLLLLASAVVVTAGAYSCVMYWLSGDVGHVIDNNVFVVITGHNISANTYIYKLSMFCHVKSHST